MIICNAEYEDLQEILQLQYLSYQSEANLFKHKDIPPLKQTLDEIKVEYRMGKILKMLDDSGNIIGSVRAMENSGTVYIGKLMVHPRYRRKGHGRQLLSEIEKRFPNKRYELFTSSRSENNLKLYRSAGYRGFGRKTIDDELEFIYLEKGLK